MHARNVSRVENTSQRASTCAVHAMGLHMGLPHTAGCGQQAAASTLSVHAAWAASVRGFLMHCASSSTTLQVGMGVGGEGMLLVRR